MPQPLYRSLDQINTRVWLTGLAEQLGRPAALDDISFQITWPSIIHGSRITPSGSCMEPDDDLARAPQNYCRVMTADGPVVLAYGGDPYFPGWPDTLQLDYSNPGTQEAMIDGNDLLARGLDLDVPPWQAAVFTRTQE